MTGISQTPNQELRDVKKRDNHRNFTPSMGLITGNVKENLYRSLEGTKPLRYSGAASFRADMYNPEV